VYTYLGMQRPGLRPRHKLSLTCALSRERQAENHSLRDQLTATAATLASPSASASILPMEAELIAQLETSINTLAEQVEHIEREKLEADATPPALIENAQSPDLQ
jgi:hypothetical protein